jgi:hypothetical protein
MWRSCGLSAVPRFRPAAHSRGPAVLSIVRDWLPVMALVPPVTVAALPGIAFARLSVVSVVPEMPVVGSWGRELWVTVRASAPRILAVRSATPAVAPKTPSAGPGMPAVPASDDDNSPNAADIRGGGADNPPVTANALDGVADIPSQISPDGRGMTAVGSGARDNCARSTCDRPLHPVK